MLYDNLVDARAKLQGTYFYYQGRAVYCREINDRSDDPAAPELYCMVGWLSNPGGKRFSISLTDPEISYMQHNLGYINSSGYALWFYRIPMRQYRQGLREDQCRTRDESGVINPDNLPHFMGHNPETGLMMENTYPSFDEAVALIKTKAATKVAFHRNFATYIDPFRKDVIIEHKGRPTAYATLNDNLEFKCTEDMVFLRESILETGIKVA